MGAFFFSPISATNVLVVVGGAEALLIVFIIIRLIFGVVLDDYGVLGALWRFPLAILMATVFAGIVGGLAAALLNVAFGQELITAAGASAAGFIVGSAVAFYITGDSIDFSSGGGGGGANTGNTAWFNQMQQQSAQQHRRFMQQNARTAQQNQRIAQQAHNRAVHRH